MKSEMIRDGQKLLADARLRLSGRLVFGDATQLAARDFLMKVGEYLDHIRTCDACWNHECRNTCPDPRQDVYYAAWSLLRSEREESRAG